MNPARATGPAVVGGIPLPGGTANRGSVFRVGDTIRRPVAPAGAATHALLEHLAAVGFTGAPRVLAVDGDTEVLSYIPGRAAHEPVPPGCLTDEALVSVAELLRGYHRAVAGFDGAGLQWQRPVPDAWTDGLVAHNDAYPGNTVFRAGRAVGLIDFDLAAPASAVWDVATAVRCWAPLQPDGDVVDARRGRVLPRFRLFLEAYGLDRPDRLLVVDALLPNHDWTYDVVRDAVADGHPAFAEHWGRVAGAVLRQRDWIAAHLEHLRAVAR